MPVWFRRRRDGAPRARAERRPPTSASTELRSSIDEFIDIGAKTTGVQPIAAETSRGRLPIHFFSPCKLPASTGDAVAAVGSLRKWYITLPYCSCHLRSSPLHPSGAKARSSKRRLSVCRAREQYHVMN